MPSLGDFFARVGFQVDVATVKQAHAAFEQIQADQKAVQARYNDALRAGLPADQKFVKQGPVGNALKSELAAREKKAAKEQAKLILDGPQEREAPTAGQGFSFLTNAVRGFLALRAVQYIRGIAEATAELATETKFTAERLGLSTAALQQLQFAATSTSVSTEALNQSLQGLQRNSLQFTKGLASTEVMRSFMQLGIGGRQLKGTGVDEQLNLIADGFQKVVDPAKRLQIATTLFGESGARLVPLLAKGRDGIGALRKEAVALGGGLSGTAIAALEDSTIATKKLDFVLMSLKGNIAASIAPWFTRMVDVVRGGVEKFRAFEKQTHLVAAVLRGGLVLGLVQVARTLLEIGKAIGLINIATFLGWGLVIAGVIVLMDELYSFFTGEKKSAISKWIDEWFGLGKAAEILKEIRDTITQIQKNWTTLPSIFDFRSAKDLSEPELLVRSKNDQRLRSTQEAQAELKRRGQNFGVGSDRAQEGFRFDLDANRPQTTDDFDPFGDPTHYPRIMRQLPSQAVLTGQAGSLPNGPGAINSTINNYIVNPDPGAVAREITRQNKQATTRMRAAIPPTDGKR